jgi:hypothetical protein
VGFNGEPSMSCVGRRIKRIGLARGHGAHEAVAARHLDVRAAAETREAGVRDANGVARSYVREGCRRRLVTILGEVDVR